jgi:hypothetical protein
MPFQGRACAIFASIEREGGRGRAGNQVRRVCARPWRNFPMQRLKLGRDIRAAALPSWWERHQSEDWICGPVGECSSPAPDCPAANRANVGRRTEFVGGLSALLCAAVFGQFVRPPGRTAALQIEELLRDAVAVAGRECPESI